MKQDTQEVQTGTSAILEQLGQAESVKLSDPFPFSCRGCGQFCCTMDTTLITPPESARINWYIERNPELKQAFDTTGTKWGELFIGSDTGLPLVKLHMLPFGDDDSGIKVCPFLGIVMEDGVDNNPNWMEMAWCAIYEVRPAACRWYPLGRMVSFDKSVDDMPALKFPEKFEWEYKIMHRCDGFTSPLLDKLPAPPWYKCVTETQTVDDYVKDMTNQDVSDEVEFYMRDVMPAWIAQHLHLATKNLPDGYIKLEMVILVLGQKIMYNQPPAPDNPEDDHKIIMEWLESLRAFPEKILKDFKEAGGNLPVKQS